MAIAAAMTMKSQIMPAIITRSTVFLQRCAGIADQMSACIGRRSAGPSGGAALFRLASIRCFGADAMYSMCFIVISMLT